VLSPRTTPKILQFSFAPNGSNEKTIYSAELIGQWQASPNPVADVAIVVKAGKVMGVYDASAFWIWSYEEGVRGVQRSSRAAVDGLQPA
jgi:hypothetical protein